MRSATHFSLPVRGLPSFGFPPRRWSKTTPWIEPLLDFVVEIPSRGMSSSRVSNLSLTLLDIRIQWANAAPSSNNSSYTPI